MHILLVSCEMGAILLTFQSLSGFPLSLPREVQFLQRVSSCKVLVGKSALFSCRPILYLFALHYMLLYYSSRKKNRKYTDELDFISITV